MKELRVKVKLSSDRILDVDISKELTIDTNNLSKELVSQAGKYAWWAVAEELSRKKVDMDHNSIDNIKQELSQEYGNQNYLGDRRLKKAVSRYVRSNIQHSFLLLIKEAFEHKRDTLMLLRDNQSYEGVLRSYNSTISYYLMALGA